MCRNQRRRRKKEACTEGLRKEADPMLIDVLRSLKDGEMVTITGYGGNNKITGAFSHWDNNLFHPSAFIKCDNSSKNIESVYQVSLIETYR